MYVYAVCVHRVFACINANHKDVVHVCDVGWVWRPEVDIELSSLSYLHLLY